MVPALPHVLFDSEAVGTHTPDAQQPLHDVPLQPHAPAMHAWPAAHEPHAMPPMPHCVSACEAKGTHTLPLQQPDGHEAASHTHAPPTHS
jgi:hypothetical protein